MPANHTDLEKRLWDAADELRANSKLKSSEYSIPVLGLIFLRYADYKFAEAEKKMPHQPAVAARSARQTTKHRASCSFTVGYWSEWLQAVRFLPKPVRGPTWRSTGFAT